MQDTALYQYLLGLQSPWTVSRVNLDVTGQRVDVWAEHQEDAAWVCPQCTKTLPRYDHAEERTWRHLDSGQFQTHLHVRIPRVACGEHGVVQVTVPWAEPRSRFTLLFERLALDVLRQCDVSGATRILRISWDEAWGLMQRAVTRGRARKPARVVRRIGVDEKAAAKGHRYLTLVCDLEGGTVEHIAEERTQESLDSYYQGLSEEPLAGIEAVAMDMWKPYLQATRAQVPGAAGKIVCDRVHVMGYLGKAVDTVRKQEHRELMASGDETLKGSQYLWLYSQEHVPERRREEFDALRRQALTGGRAWAIKESLRRLWHYVYPASGWKFWKRWYFWATHSRLEPIRKAAETVRRHIDNILTYYQHPVTNAMSEGLNSQIVFWSGTESDHVSPRNFWNESRSLSGYSVCSSERLSYRCSTSTLNIITTSWRGRPTGPLTSVSTARSRSCRKIFQTILALSFASGSGPRFSFFMRLS